MAMHNQDNYDLIEEFTYLGGNTEAYNEAHVIARVALLNRIVSDQRWYDLVTEWAGQTGLLQHAKKCRDLWLELLELIGEEALEQFWQGADIINISVNDNEDAETLQAKIRSLFSRADTESELFYNDLSSSNHARSELLTNMIEKFVREDLRLPWVWVAWELIERAFADLFGYSTATIWTQHQSVELLNPPAPPLSITFTTYPGESAREARARLLEEISKPLEQFDAILEDTYIPKGQRRMDMEESIEQQVDCFFRHRVLGDSIYSINLYDGEDQKRPIPLDRSNVKRNIERAIGLLGIQGIFWPDAKEEDIELARKYWLEAGGDDRER
jgi:hypothetical protein